MAMRRGPLVWTPRTGPFRAISTPGSPSPAGSLLGSATGPDVARRAGCFWPTWSMRPINRLPAAGDGDGDEDDGTGEEDGGGGLSTGSEGLAALAGRGGASVGV